jgi:Flp pilus assembly protein TadG
MHRPNMSSERGAILLHVAIAMVTLIAVNTFVVDYGVMWVGRRQAQNAADAGALAGAVAMAFDPDGLIDQSETGPARQAAHQVALSNTIWGEPPDVNIATDVFFTNQPADMCQDSDGNPRCIRVNVYRNQERGNYLPSLFGLAVGLTGQGVRATATARVAVADATDCLKPVAIPDKWLDVNDTTAPTAPAEAWTQDDTFETHTKQGNSWNPLANPDVYVAPSETDPGTGFTVAADLGMRLVLSEGAPGSVTAGGYAPVQLPRPDGGTGGHYFRENIKYCNGVPVVIGETLPAEEAEDIPDLAHVGFHQLIDRDPDAEWDPSTNSVVNSCAQDSTPCAAHSPRVVAIPVYDTGQYYNGIVNGQAAPPITLVNIVGFFVDWEGREDGQYIVEGYITEAPGLETGGTGITPQSSLLSQIQLVR